MAAMAPSKRTLALFDIDGTLTPARKTISPEMRAFMQTLRGKITVGVVMDRTMGNTGGLGGVFGLFSAIGSPLPFPEARPWKMSKRYRFFQWLGRLSAKKAEAKK